LLANAVTLRRDKPILFNRVVILILLYSGILGYDSLYIGSLDTGIGVFSDLFHSTTSSDIYIYYMKNINLHRPQGYLFKVSSAHSNFRPQGYLFKVSSAHSNSRPQLAGFTSSRACASNCAYSTLTNEAKKLDPYFVTGFTDGEGCFRISILKDNRNPKETRYNYNLCFSIGLHIRDAALLQEIKTYFGVGRITALDKEADSYVVTSLKDLAVIIAHFDKYPLITQKLADYLLFKQAFELISRKEHLAKDGYLKLAAIKSSMNKGLPSDLKAIFPSVTPIPRPFVVDQVVPDLNWLAGFATAEGCFMINVYKGTTNVGFKVMLRFKIGQSDRDEALMKSLTNYLGCGG